MPTLLLAILLSAAPASTVMLGPPPPPVPMARPPVEPPAAEPQRSSAPPEVKSAPQVSAARLVAPLVALVGLAGAAIFLSRRRRVAGRYVQILETTSLGPKRSVVVARMGSELLILGASEAGVTLLATRAADAGGAAAAEPPQLLSLHEVPPPEPSPTVPAAASRLAALFRHRAAAAAPVTGFDALLTESAEDLDLRRKLARGQAGSVR